MDLSNFNLLKEDNENYHIGHPSGKGLVVRKDALSPKAHEAIKKMACGGMAHYNDGTPPGGASALDAENAALDKPEWAGDSYEGTGLIPYHAPGDVNSPTMYASPDAIAKLPGGQDQLPPDRSPAMASSMSDGAQGQNIPLNHAGMAYNSANGGSWVGGYNNSGTPGMSPPDSVSTMTQPNTPMALSTSAPQGGPSPAGGTQATLPMSGIDQEIKGQQDLASALGTQGKNEANAIDTGAIDIGEQPSLQDLIQKNQGKDQQFAQQFASGKVDPMHYIKNMSTGDHVLTGISMILGGIGGGLTGQQNVGMQMFENNINRDIQAQQNSQDTTMNLWKMNREALGTNIQANIATKNQMYTALQYQLKKQAALSANPIAQSNAEIAIGGLQRQKDMMAFQQSLFNPTQETAGGAAPGTEQAANNHENALQRASAMGMPGISEVEKDFHSRMIPGVGMATIAPTPENRAELTEWDALQKTANKALAFQQKQGGAGIGAWSPENRAIAYGLQQDMLQHYNELGNMKRMAPEGVQRATRVIGNPGSFDMFGGTAAGLKTLMGEIQNNKQTSMEHLGVIPFVQPPIDKNAVAWAQDPKNANDPRALKILQKNGLR